eukprot:1565141-Pleurochrysis_carterae.AAC.1
MLSKHASYSRQARGGPRGGRVMGAEARMVGAWASPRARGMLVILLAALGRLAASLVAGSEPCGRQRALRP